MRANIYLTSGIVAAMAQAPTLIVDPEKVEDVARTLEGSGWFALDLEFLSEGRYIPELCVVQVAWPEPEPGLALIDAQEVDAAPIFAVIESPDTQVVAHAARQDLALLSTRFGVRARAFWDAQLAAAFAGIGEQVGYARLIKELCDVQVDKGPQFTNWSKRPLSPRQLRYAADDVRYLRQGWPVLRRRLEERGRLGWVAEESAALVAEVSTRRPPEAMYRSVGGWGQLRGGSLGALAELAAWREREALESNKPPSWILPDNALITLCRKKARNEAALKRVKGVGQGTVRRYGAEVIAAIERGLERDDVAPRRRAHGDLSAERQALAHLVYALIQSRCAGETLPPKLVGSRADAEALVESVLGDGGDEDVSLTQGWRRELVGAEAEALLTGEAVLEIAGGRVQIRSNPHP